MKKLAYRKKKSKAPKILVAVLLLLVLLGALLYKPVARMVWEYRYPTDYAAEVQQWSAAYNVDPWLVYAIIRTESGFDPEAESNVGARGLMQMTDETFEWLKGKIAREEPLTYGDLYQPNTSVRFGVYFISLCLERYGGDVSTAAAAYHSGWGTVDKLLADGAYSDDGVRLREFPYSQMAHYVSKVNNSYNKYIELYAKE